MSEKRSLMNKISDFLQKKLIPIAAKVGEQRHLTALKKGLMSTISLTIIGGFALILAKPPVDPKIIKPTNLFNKMLLTWKAWSVANYQTLMTPYRLTLGLIAVFAVVAIAYNLAKYYKMNTLSASITSLLTFLVVSAPPTSVDPSNPRALFMSTKYLDAKGLFTAILIGLITVEITRFMDKKGIKIKMPESVPPTVSASFEALIPIIVNVILFMFINKICINFLDVNISQAIMNIFAPLVSSVDSLGGIILTTILINGLWLFGIHGGAIVNAIITPFLTMNILANADAVISGQQIPHVFTSGFRMFFVTIGGCGAAVGLVIAIMICAKSVHLKTVGKMGFIPSLFNISEPIIFGTPIVMNPLMALPVLIAPIVNAIIAYSAVTLNIIGKTYVVVPFTTPGPIGAFLTTMDWKAVVLWFLIVAIDVVIYFPFVKIYDKTLLEKEQVEA